LPQLREALGDTDPNCRVAAAAAIWPMDFGSKEVVAVVRRELRNPNETIRSEATVTLLMFGRFPEADLQWRQAVAQCFDEVASVAQSDPDPQTRFFATLVLRGGGDRAVPVLLRLLDDADARVRSSAVRILALLGPVAKDAAPRLLALVEKK